MLVLFDSGTPRTLARYLIDHHTVTEARARGWEKLENGELLSKAAAATLSRCFRTMRHAEFPSTTMAIVRPFKFCW